MMMTIKFTALGVLLIGLAPAMAQSVTPKFVLGAVDGFAVESPEIRVKPDKGETLSLKLRADTQVVKVPAGAPLVTKAKPLEIPEGASGSHVLETLVPHCLQRTR